MRCYPLIWNHLPNLIGSPNIQRPPAPFLSAQQVLSLVKLVAPQLGFGRSQPAEALPQPAPGGVVAFKDLPGGLRAVRKRRRGWGFCRCQNEDQTKGRWEN